MGDCLFSDSLNVYCLSEEEIGYNPGKRIIRGGVDATPQLKDDASGATLYINLKGVNDINYGDGALLANAFNKLFSVSVEEPQGVSLNVGNRQSIKIYIDSIAPSALFGILYYIREHGDITTQESVQ